MDRRKFLKYAGATGAVVGASALGLNYLSKPQRATPSQETTTATTATATITSSSTAIVPMITGLTYEPSRVLNSKIYDIRVDLEISNPAKRSLSVQVVLEPVVYAYLPSEAFASEQSKAITLQTTGLESELLSAYFANVKGGREYDVEASANDGSVVVDARTLRTEYVREFENIAGLDDMTVIADYYTWGGITGTWTDKGNKMHVYTPLLGEYDSGDPIVIDKHIDWASGFGVDAFAVSWWGPNKIINGFPYIHETTSKFEEGFLKSPMLSQTKFCILYENNGRLKIQNPNDPGEEWIEDLDDPDNRETLVSDFEYLAKYFSSPHYLKIDGKPYVRFDYTLPFRGDIEGAFAELRNALRERGWELYLANDLLCRSFYPEDLISQNVRLQSDYTPYRSPKDVLQVIESFDAISGSSPPILPPPMEFPEAYKMWHDFSVNNGKEFMPVSWPGMEGSPLLYPGPPVKLSPELFRTTFDSSIKCSTRKAVEITSFNEWIAGHQIEPAEEYGLTYLEALKDVLVKTKT